MSLLLSLALLGANRASGGGGVAVERRKGGVAVRPAVLSASHSIIGYEPHCAADGNDQTFWLVPGGQRMEMMSCVLHSTPSISCLASFPYASPLTRSACPPERTSGLFSTWEKDVW